ncbi:excisionase family DNA-binding protein [Flavobacterium ponti]|uniref:Excisionase family DNA-binding protein n=1 Tax=Flavobacterium ponti TaxID=665133 RepID=A0ABV9P4Q0_9FLAO
MNLLKMEIQKLPPRFLTRYEAAAFLTISVKTVDRLIRDNRIKAFKLGKRVLIHYDSLTEENINAVRPKFQN